MEWVSQCLCPNYLSFSPRRTVSTPSSHPHSIPHSVCSRCPEGAVGGSTDAVGSLLPLSSHEAHILQADARSTVRSANTNNTKTMAVAEWARLASLSMRVVCSNPTKVTTGGVPVSSASSSRYRYFASSPHCSSCH